ncbi:YciI family protein [Fulvivirgaceae bacterium BMA10]|uniref:YciI family protein n=1 Tax=Splendidivirga corallicola TaxID=3051826 RepID=A0ABT8KRK4_9BACT|nr:YciI family protein [Fulvivirgaceae bacterium BMA10]
MKQFLILIKGKKELSYEPEALQKRMDEYRQWVETIEDHYISDQRLERTGAYIKDKQTISTDGPFLESKEIIAGYTIIQAEDLNNAISIAKSCPLLNHFELIVRPIVDSTQ